MIAIYASVAVALVVAGAVIGILTVISVGTRHEQMARSFTTRSPSPAASGVRAINGHYARRPGVTAPQYARPPGVAVRQAGPRRPDIAA